MTRKPLDSHSLFFLLQTRQRADDPAIVLLSGAAQLAQLGLPLLQADSAQVGAIQSDVGFRSMVLFRSTWVCLLDWGCYHGAG